MGKKLKHVQILKAMIQEREREREERRLEMHESESRKEVTKKEN